MCTYNTGPSAGATTNRIDSLEASQRAFTTDHVWQKDRSTALHPRHHVGIVLGPKRRVLCSYVEDVHTYNYFRSTGCDEECVRVNDQRRVE